MTSDEAARSRLLAGGEFAFEEPDDVAAVWGSGTNVAWAAGEPLIIAGSDGVGKTSLAQQLVLARGGVREPTFLGLPVAPSTRPVLYIAADRPRQAARSLRRMVNSDDRDRLNRLLAVWPGPLPFDLAREPHKLLLLAEQVDAGTVVIDSLKDVAFDLTDDSVGARVNSAFQRVVAAGIELLAQHHDRKQGKSPSTRRLADVYGSRWLTAGAGSVLFVDGSPGAHVVRIRHLKQPAEDIGPLRVEHDHRSGVSTLVDIPDLARALQARGELTARDAARYLFGEQNPPRSRVEKARRELNLLVDAGVAVRTPEGRETIYVARR